MTADLLCAPGVIGIEVAAADVVLDLGGHTLRGGGGEPAVLASHDGFTLRNGRIASWDGTGVSTASRAFIEDVEVENVTGTGLLVNAASTIVRCNVQGANVGIEGASRVIVERTSVGNTQGDGIVLGQGALVRECSLSAAPISSDSPSGIDVGHDSIVDGCRVAFSAGHGIRVEGGSLVTRSSVRNAARASVILGDGATALNVSVSDFGYTGLSVGSNALARECIVRNGTGNGLTLFSGRAVDCTVSFAGQDGIHGYGASTIERCNVTRSGQSGIACEDPLVSVIDTRSTYNQVFGVVVQEESVVTGGLFAYNASHGIWSRGDGNYVADNRVYRNGSGVVLTGQDSLAVNNTCFGNGVDFHLPLSNTMGPLIKNQSFIQSSNPWANLVLDF